MRSEAEALSGAAQGRVSLVPRGEAFPQGLPVRMYIDDQCSGARMGIWVLLIAPPQLGKPMSANPVIMVSTSPKWMTLCSRMMLIALTTCRRRQG